VIHMFIVVQVNPIAGLLPDHSPLPATAQSNGLSFMELLSEIIMRALRRTARTSNSVDPRTNQMAYPRQFSPTSELSVSESGT
jgi:hypothetical protein